MAMIRQLLMTRRRALGALLAFASAPLSFGREIRAMDTHSTAAKSAPTYDALVVGAGVFGAWTAWHLLQLGQRVLLVDAWDPAHARASSGGESRLTRTAYGHDTIYSRMAWQSLEDWRWLSTRATEPLFHPVGVLFFFQRVEPYLTRTLEVHRELGIPIETLDRATLGRRYPQIAWDGIETALFEPDRGVLMARRAVRTLVAEFVAAGGEYRQCAVEPPDAARAPVMLATSSGETLRAGQVVFACGPWLPKLFPDLLAPRIFPTRQEVFFFRTPAGDASFSVPRLPGWIGFNDGDIYYGFPDLEGRGFKIAHDRHGERVDPDTLERVPSASALEDVRGYLRRRFPQLADAPVSEARVCQYANSSNGDLLIDRHPSLDNVWLVGAGSGHGFKHGPAVGRYAAARITGKLPHREVEPRFSLASKATIQERAVH
jgi:monomeric sarcosine oxidase